MRNDHQNRNPTDRGVDHPRKQVQQCRSDTSALETLMNDDKILLKISSELN